MSVVDQSRMEDCSARPVDWLESRTTHAQSAVHRQQWAFPHSALGSRERSRLHHPRSLRSPASSRLAPPLRLYTTSIGNIGRRRTIPRNLLPCGQLDLLGSDYWRSQNGPSSPSPSSDQQTHIRFPAAPARSTVSPHHRSTSGLTPGLTSTAVNKDTFIYELVRESFTNLHSTPGFHHCFCSFQLCCWIRNWTN